MIEASGANGFLTFDGRALVIWRVGRGQVTVPARQVAAIDVRPLGLKCIVTTSAGRSYKISYWPGRGKHFHAIAAAVASA